MHDETNWINQHITPIIKKNLMATKKCGHLFKTSISSFKVESIIVNCMQLQIPKAKPPFLCCSVPLQYYCNANLSEDDPLMGDQAVYWMA